LKRQNDTLNNEPTDSELPKILLEAEQQNNRLKQRLEKNKQSGMQVVDPNEAKKIEAKYEFSKREWRNRKRKVI
jgi:hypothetical protein